MKSVLTLAVVVALITAVPAAANAQARSATSQTQGLFGATTLGGTAGASPSGLGTGMTTGMGATGMQGGNGMQGNMGMQGQTQFGVATGTTGMQQIQRGGQSGFVGVTAQTVQNPFATQQGGVGGRGGTQNFNMLTQLMAQAQRNQFNQQQAQRNQRTGQQAQSQFRVPMRLGFQPTAIPPQRIGGFNDRLVRMPGLTSMGPLQVSLEGRTAVLRGTVATESDRQLAEGLAMLEPEVMAVRNELVVGSAGTTAEAPLPATAP